MGKSSKPKQEVNLYFMSIHFGICAQADAMKRIVIKEKVAWSGYATRETSFIINKPELFGGNKKEGGVAGTVHWLPGLDTQVLPDILATRLGRADGLDAPGYRGLASAWFIGGASGSGGGGLAGLFEHLLKTGSNSKGGFYWSANQPYLPGTWIEVERSPKGLDQSVAMILRPGTNQYPYVTHTGAGHGIDLLSPDEGLLYQIDAPTLFVWSLETRELVAQTTMSASIGGFGVGDGKIWAQVGPFFAPQLWSFDLDGTGGSLVLDTLDAGSNPNFDGVPAGATYKGGRVCFYTQTQNEAYQLVFTDGRVNQYLCGFRPHHYLTDADDRTKTWCVGNDQFTGNNLWIAEVPSATGTMVGSTDGDCFAMDNGVGQLLVWQAGQIMLYDKTTLTLVDSAACSVSSGFAQLAFDSVQPGASSIWIIDTEYSTRTLAPLRTIDLTDWFAESGFGRGYVYDPRSHALVTNVAPDETMSWRLLDRGERDANPAHIIYECLTNTDWGMGSPSSLIDLDSFDDAAQVLFDEPLGLSMIWTRQAAIQDFIQEVLDHIQAVLFVDPQTGLLTLKLIRGDYVVDDLPTIDESTATLTNFGRKLWGEIVNEITVTWTNPDNEQDETVTAHDLASITTQGGIVSDSRNYYGVRSPLVAARLAARDLRSAGAPLATCEAEVDRSQWALRPASVLRLDWPEYGLEGVVMRVTSIDYGKPGDMAIKLVLVEDVFGLDAGTYIEPPTSSWEDPSSAPAALEHQAVFTMPLFFAANSTVAAFVETPEYPEVIAGVLGTTSNDDTFSWELWDEVPLPDGTPEWTNLQTETVAGYAELLVAIDAEAETTLDPDDFDNAMGQTGPSTGGFVLIGDGAEETSEIALITSAGTDFTVSRGALDTVPRAWPIGTPVWFLDTSSLIEDPLIRSAFEEVSYKFRTRTSQGLLPLAAAPTVEYTLTERPWLPNRPADVKAYGVAFSSADDPIDALARPDPWVTVEWAERNRLTEDSQVLAWTDATTAPETDQTTTITVIAGSDGVTVLDTHTGLTGTTFDVPDSSFGSEPVVILRTSSSRTDDDGTFESLQSFDHWVTVGVAGGAEASGGVGAFSPVGAAVVEAVFSSSGAGALSGSGLANSSGAFSGSGTGAMAAVGEDAGSAYGSHPAWRLQIDSNNGGATRTSLTAIRFKDAGGNLIATTGGTAFSGGSGSDELNADVARAFDSNSGTTWSRSSTTNVIAGYIFAANQAVATVEMDSGTSFNTSPAVCRLQYSDDTTTGIDGTWATAFEIWEPSWGASGQTKAWPQTLGAGSYKAFRWNITASNDASFTLIQEAQIMATVGGADQCNNGLAFGSQANTNEEPSKAFDNADGNNYDLHIPVTGTLGYYVETAFAPAQYSVRCNNTNSRTPKTWDFQGSNDPTGASWTTLNSQSNQTWSVPETKTYTI